MTIRRSLLVALIALAAVPVIARENCFEAVEKVMAPAPKPAVDFGARAAKVLERELSAAEKQAVTKAKEIAPGDVYTGGDVIAQNKLLKKAGFSDKEIETLRKKGVLGNEVLSLANGAPKGIEVREMALREIGRGDLKELREGKTISYLVSEDGRLFATGALDFPADKILVAAGKTPIAIREGGTLVYDASKRSYGFKPTYAFETSAVEAKDLLSQAHSVDQGAKFFRETPKGIPQSRVVKCLDVLSSHAGGKNFVLDRMITDNMVTVGAIAASEIGGAKRLQTDEGVKIVLADIVGGNITGYVGSKIGKQLVMKDANFMTSMAVRTGIGLGSIEAQKQFHKIALANEKDGKGASEDIASFNRAHFIARLPVNHYFDQFMVKQLPNMVFNSCLERPGMSVLIGPRSVRLYERYASSTIYYGLRSAIVGQ